jgi:hypothetical protein
LVALQHHPQEVKYLPLFCTENNDINLTVKCSLYPDNCLLRWRAVWSGKNWSTFRRWLLPPSSGRWV